MGKNHKLDKFKKTDIESSVLSITEDNYVIKRNWESYKGMRKCICVECIARDSSAGLLGGDVQCAAESMGLKAGKGTQVWIHKSGNHPHRGDD